MANQKFKTKVQADAGVQLTQESTSKALQLDASGNIQSSAVTTTELGYLSGTTGSLQSQLTGKQSTSEKGQANGYAALDSGGKVPVAQLPNSIMEYKGTYNAATNTPTLVDGTGDTGDVYRVTVAGAGVNSLNFVVGDYAIYNGTTWEKAHSGADAVISVFGRAGAVTAQSGDYTTDQVTEGTNLYFTDERAQDAVGTILTDTASVDFTYNDAGNTISAVVLPAGVNHDALQNFIANKHIDHSSVVLSGAANGGITSTIGDITASRSISVDITNAVAETSADNADLLLIYDNSATALRKMSRANFLSGFPTSSAGDLNEASFSAANSQASPANVTGFAFSNAVVRSFKALVSVEIDATADLFETFELQGIQKGASWDMAVSSVGDDSGVTFSITSSGQVQYISQSYAGFVSALIKFRAQTTSF